MTNIKKNNYGRPAGRIKLQNKEISIEPTVKDEFMTLLCVRRKNCFCRNWVMDQRVHKNMPLGEEE